LVVLCCALAAAFVPVSAGAAPAPVVLGQVGNAFNTNFATSSGGCQCTVAQMHEASPSANPYVIPYDGVLVSAGTYVGESVEATDTIQAETLRRTGTSTGTVISEGFVHNLAGVAISSANRFRDRLSADAGDVLAMRLHDSGFIQSTPYVFKAAAADEVRVAEAVGVGGSLSGGGSAAERRVNLEAVLEPDEDNDGYGDFSQDLCPGSPIALSACTGSLFGSNLQGEFSAKPAPCLSSCLYLQTALGGASTIATSPGVIVRWRVLNGGTGAYRMYVLKDNPEGSGGMFLAYRIIGSSESEHVDAPLPAAISKTSSFATRVPLPVGTYIGVAVPGGELPGFQSSAGGQAKYSRVATPATPGATGVVGESHNGVILYDADVEPDIDADGYGDVSQDSCPSAATVHEGPCPAAAPTGETSSGAGASSGSGASPGTGPAPKKKQPSGGPASKIGSLTVKPKSFHAKPLGGASAGGAFGTKVKLSLSAAATVTLAIEARHGHAFKVVTRLIKKLAAGRASVAFSGQYRRAGKPTDLAPGTYRLSATAKGSAGTGPVRRTAFTVLPPA
jgi:outer membrane lipoprotein SlyB